MPLIIFPLPYSILFWQLKASQCFFAHAISSSHFCNMHFFPFNKILAHLAVFLERHARSSCSFFPVISSKIYHTLLYSWSLHHLLSSLARNDYKYAWSNSLLFDNQNSHNIIPRQFTLIYLLKLFLTIKCCWNNSVMSVFHGFK